MTDDRQGAGGREVIIKCPLCGNPARLTPMIGSYRYIRNHKDKAGLVCCRYTEPWTSGREKLIDADARAAGWLGRFNQLLDAGKDKTPACEAALRKSQYWLDRANKLRGDS